MGYEISYCASCQNQVRGADLEKHLAIRVDDLAYCVKCAPGILKTLPAHRVDEVLGRVPSPPPIRKGSTSRIPKVQSNSSGRLQAQSGTSGRLKAQSGTSGRLKAQSGTSNRLKAQASAAGTPPPPRPRPPDRKPLLIASAAGAAVLVIAVVALLLSSGSSPQAPERPPERATEPPAPAKKALRPAENFEASKALADLDQFVASSAQPLEILIRCDEIKGIVRGTPQEARWREIQARAQEAKKVKDAEQAITMGLEQVRSLRKFDLRYEKKAEIHNLLDRMKAMGGPRQGEVLKTIEDYDRETREGEARLRGLAAWYRFSLAVRLGADDSGHAYTAGSTDGVSWNGSFPDGGRGARFGGAGMIVVPVSIRDDFTIALWLRTRMPPIGTLQWFEGQGLVDAEFPGVVDDFGTALLQGKFAFGVGNPDTTLRSRSAVNDGRWHHVAATRESASGRMTVYVDGASEGTTTGPTGAKTMPTRMVIGGLQTGANLFFGEIDDVRLYTRALAADEIRDLARPDGR